MADRETHIIPAEMRAQVNFEMRGDQLAMLDDNARFIVRAMVAKAYKRGYDDGWFAGQDDYRTDRDIKRDAASSAQEGTS